MTMISFHLQNRHTPVTGSVLSHVGEDTVGHAEPAICVSDDDDVRTSGDDAEFQQEQEEAFQVVKVLRTAHELASAQRNGGFVDLMCERCNCIILVSQAQILEIGREGKSISEQVRFCRQRIAEDE